MIRKIDIVNIILLLTIIIYQFFFLDINFRYDFILISIFFVFNIKNIRKFMNKNMVNTMLVISIFLFTIFLMAQAILLRDSNVSMLRSIYNYRYVIIYLSYPVLLLPTICSIKISDKLLKIIKIIFIICTYIICIYGICTYVFNWNLVQSGMYILDGYTGRISSFFGNPNCFAFLLLLFLILYLFDFNLNIKLKYSLVLLIVINICLTYGRYAYATMGLIFLIYIIYVIFNKKIQQKLIKIFLIFLLMYFTLYLPNNNYLYLSLLNKFERMTSINTSKTISNIIDKIVFIDDQTNKKVLTDKLEIVSKSETSSEGTRILFKNIALELFDENKYIGVGSLNYNENFDKKLMEKNINYVNTGLPHNNYIYLLCNYGLIGTILYLIILILILIYLINNSRKINNIISLSIFIFFLITNFMDDLMLKNFFPYIIIAIASKMSYTKIEFRSVKK